jgi:hypothetical protein
MISRSNIHIKNREITFLLFYYLLQIEYYTLPEAPSAQPEAPSAPEGEALRVEEERSGVTPNRNWQTPYLQYLHRGELPLDRAEARRLARRAKSFVLLGDEKELYHRSPSGILQ